MSPSVVGQERAKREEKAKNRRQAQGKKEEQKRNAVEKGKKGHLGDARDEVSKVGGNGADAGDLLAEAEPLADGDRARLLVVVELDGDVAKVTLEGAARALDNHLAAIDGNRDCRKTIVSGRDLSEDHRRTALRVRDRLGGVNLPHGWLENKEETRQYGSRNEVDEAGWMDPRSRIG